MNVLFRGIICFLCFFTISCSEDVDAPFIGDLVDINPKPNQVSDPSNKNGIEIGLTVYTSSQNGSVSYQLLESANGRFTIDSSTGVVYLADYLLLNARIYPKHFIRVLAKSSDGAIKTEIFEISVMSIKGPVIAIPVINTPLYEQSNYNEYFSRNVINIYENDIPIVSTQSVLLDWDDGAGTRFSGWDWDDDIAYGNPGWLLSDSGPYGGKVNFKWGKGVRSFNKSGRDGKQKNIAYIDLLDKSPSKSSGGNLKITEKSTSALHRSTWWVWYDGKPLSERGITNKRTDRMSFYMKTRGMDGLKDDGGKSSIRNNFHIGTYLCWYGNKNPNGTGDGCPYEGPGNQHYYHYLAINPGTWIHVLLDQHPQHLRGKKGSLNNNPPFRSYRKNYFEQLSQFYFDIKQTQKKQTSLSIDELVFFSTKDMVEANQNEESITSLWVGYWGDNSVWEIGFQDGSYASHNDNTNSTYEVRWSTLPINNNNFEEAKPIIAKFYSGEKVTGEKDPTLIRRQSGWRKNVWTRFTLSENVENKYLKIFFAVRDVSKKGAHKGSKWPYTFGDGHDAPTSNIKIIDYYLRPPAN